MSLYLKYRPKSFSDIIGQEHIIKVLKNSLSTNSLNHAYLFSGPRGSGKTSTARVLAKAINCIAPIDSEPCLVCEHCKSVQDGNFLDLIEIDAASNRKVDDIRELKEKVVFAPQSGKYKVYIIDEAHMLTSQAFNAFLKMLEEPPEHVVFILATTEPEKLLPTIISRCQRHNFHKVSPPVIAEYLSQIWKNEKEEHSLGEIDFEALLTISRLSDGALRDSIGMLEQLFFLEKNNIDIEDINNIYGLVSSDNCSMLIDLIKSSDLKGIKQLSQKILESGTNVSYFLQSLIDFIKERLLSSSNDSQVLLIILENVIDGLEKLKFHPFPAEVLDIVLFKSALNINIDPLHNKSRKKIVTENISDVSEKIIPAKKDEKTIKIEENISETNTSGSDNLSSLILSFREDHPSLISNLESAILKKWTKEKIIFIFKTPFEYKYFSYTNRKKELESLIKKKFGYSPSLEFELDTELEQNNVPENVKKVMDIFGAEVFKIIDKE